MYLSIIGQNISNFIKCKIKLFKKNITLIYGYNDESFDMASSNKDYVILVDELDRTSEYRLFINNISYINIKQGGFDRLINVVKNQSQKKNKRIVLIVNNGFNDKIKCITRLTDLVDSYNYECESSDEFQDGLNVYIIANENEISSFKSIIKKEKAKGRIRMIDKHDLIAMDFVSKYPITKYMDDEFINYSTGAIIKDKNINMIYIGFGDTNKSLFLTEFANNALYTFDGDKLVSKKIKYIFYDKKNPKNNLDLNHSIFRYFLEKNDYKKEVPLPDLPFEYREDMFRLIDINDNSFYNDLVKSIDNSYTYIHICIGDDIANINLAKKISKKLMEHNYPDNVKIFVRVRSNELARKLNDVNLNVYGTDDVMSNISNIINEKYYGMALDRHIF